MKKAADVQATAAARATGPSQTIPQRIIRRLKDIYTDPSKGLLHYASLIGEPLLPPPEKLSVMLIGNHSAGKSSFINWYVQDSIQRVGMAMETTGVTFVTSGKKRETLTGLATLELYPQFKALQTHCRLSAITTEVSTSTARQFPMITFIDTPGLVDGDMQYPFDVERTIQWLSERVDVILVFFDPMGQALCKRTLDVVERFYSSGQSSKVRLYMSKADQVPLEKDRQRVLMQITQNLCKRAGLNQYGFDLETIYIPSQEKESTCVNQIEEVCKEFEKNINLMVQNTLNRLDQDCHVIAAGLKTSIVAGDVAAGRVTNRRLFLTAAIFMLLTLLVSTVALQLDALLGIRVALLASVYDASQSLEWTSLVSLQATALLLLVIFLKVWPARPPLSSEQLHYRRSQVPVVMELATERKSLYAEYIQDAVPLPQS